jgi:citrate/tricarballylate utilization protein
VFPHNLLVGLFAPVFGFAVLALALGVRRFWRDVSPATTGARSAGRPRPRRGQRAALKYLGRRPWRGLQQRGRRAGRCARRRFHHATFYGFMLCFAATSVATLYHYVWAGGAVRADQPAQAAGHVAAASACCGHGRPVAG